MGKAAAPWAAASRKRATEQAIERVAAGESLRSVSRDEMMPSLTTLNDWLHAEKYAEQYARAREERAAAIFEECLEIADDAAGDMIADPETGEARLNSEHVQRSRLRIDTRKWMVGKMQPKKYGDKLDLNHDVGDGLGKLLDAVANNGSRLGDD